MIDMEIHSHAQAGQSPPISRYRAIRNKITNWLYLNIWCKHLYRHVMRLMHRFDLHYCPPYNRNYGKREHWCQWCGLRGNTWVIDTKVPLEYYLPKLVPSSHAQQASPPLDIQIC